jgi:hypothetical protein
MKANILTQLSAMETNQTIIAMRAFMAGTWFSMNQNVLAMVLTNLTHEIFDVTSESDDVIQETDIVISETRNMT